MRRNGLGWVALKRRSSWSIALAVAALAAVPAARAIDSMGTEFLLAFPETVPPDPVQTLLITSQVATSGTVSNPSLGINVPFVAAPGSATLVSLPNTVELALSDTVEAKGLLVTALDPIAVFGVNRRSGTTGAFLALPTAALGSDYRVATWGPGLGIGSQLAVVATVDGTSVTITPSVSVVGHPAGVPFAVALDRGDTYYLRADLGTDDDLTGTSVASNQPVALFGAHTCASVPDTDTDSCDGTIEQLLPGESWGVEFLTVPFATRTAGDLVRVLAAQDGTEVRLDGALVATLAAGESYDASRTTATWITASAPVLVTQLAKGGTADGPGEVFGDPLQTLVVPTSLYRDSYVVAVPELVDLDPWFSWVNLVVPNDAIGSVTLDGAPVAPASFTPIGTSGFSAAQIETTFGAHALAAERPFGVTVYGQRDADAYGYPGGTDFFRAPAVQAIPALSTWGLGALAALLAAGALLLLQRGRA